MILPLTARRLSCTVEEPAFQELPVFRKLMAVIEDRKANPSVQSYTAGLLAGGSEKIGGKIVEEAAEVVDAAREPGDEGRTHLVREAADLMYHLFVMLACRNVRLEEVEQELAHRFGISGLEEKASRRQQDPT